MNRLTAFLLTVLLSFTTQAGWYITNDVTGGYMASGIVDGSGNTNEFGILGGSMDYHATGVLDASSSWHEYGILYPTYEPTYASSGIVFSNSVSEFYHTPWEGAGIYTIDGIDSVVYNGASGILDPSGVYNGLGILSYDSGTGTTNYNVFGIVGWDQGTDTTNYHATGILVDLGDGYYAHHASGVLGPDADVWAYLEFGMVDVNGYVDSVGGMVNVGGYPTYLNYPLVIDSSGYGHTSGVLDGSGVYASGGLLDPATSCLTNGIWFGYDYGTAAGEYTPWGVIGSAGLIASSSPVSPVITMFASDGTVTASESYGIVDMSGTYSSGGLLDPADGYVKSGIWDGYNSQYHNYGIWGNYSGDQYFSYGAVGADGTAYPGGMLFDGSGPIAGIVDSSLAVWGTGILDGGGNHYATGILDILAQQFTSGIYDAAGEGFHANGIYYGNDTYVWGGTYTASGILDGSEAYYSSGIIDGSGTYNGFGILSYRSGDDTTNYNAWGSIGNDNGFWPMVDPVDGTGHFAGIIYDAGANFAYQYFGILDVNATYASWGIISSAGILTSISPVSPVITMFASDGTVTASESYGIVDFTGTYNPWGVLDLAFYYRQYGMVDLNGYGNNGGMQDASGNYYATGIFDTDSVWNYNAYGILDGSGTYASGGLLDPADSTLKGGIWEDYTQAYHAFGLSYATAGVTNYSSAGVLDGSGTYSAAGMLEVGYVFHQYGIMPGIDGVWRSAGIIANDANAPLYEDGTYYDISNAVHTVAGGLVSASTIGAFAGTANLIPEYLKLDVTVDDVTGTLSGGASKPGFGGGAFSQ